MGNAENLVGNQCCKYAEMLGLKVWRNQVLQGWYRPTKHVKEYYIRTGTPGLADYALLTPNGKTIYFEAKKKKGKQQDSQKEFQAECKRFNVPYILADSFDSFKKQLDQYIMEM